MNHQQFSHSPIIQWCCRSAMSCAYEILRISRCWAVGECFGYFISTTRYMWDRLKWHVCLVKFQSFHSNVEKKYFRIFFSACFWVCFECHFVRSGCCVWQNQLHTWIDSNWKIHLFCHKKRKKAYFHVFRVAHLSTFKLKIIVIILNKKLMFNIAENGTDKTFRVLNEIKATETE